MSLTSRVFVVARHSVGTRSLAASRAGAFDDMSPISDNFFVEVPYTDVFEDWLRDLNDVRGKSALLIRIERMEDGHFGDHHSVGGGVSELRINVGLGYRVYYTIRQPEVVILPCGGDKDTQDRDMRRARRLAEEL